MRRNYKSKQIEKHFARRSIERVGYFIDPDPLVKLIQKNELEFIGKQSNRVSLWKYTLKDIDYKLVYDKNRKKIITIIPLSP